MNIININTLKNEFKISLKQIINTLSKNSKGRNAFIFLLGILLGTLICRVLSNNEPVIKEVEIPVEKVIYLDKSDEYDDDAKIIARVLYGVKEYNLSKEQKTAIVEVILNRKDDKACEFRTVNTISEVCNQDNQWQGYNKDGNFLSEDYQIALERLNDNSGARTIPEGCFFLTVNYHEVEVRTLFNGGNKWKV